MHIIWVNKPIGWTPKQCVNEVKKLYNGKICFAGRLDPMAYGLLPLIINGHYNDISNLQSCYKTYRFKVILGIQTDTYDILGEITNITNNVSYSNPLPIVSQEYPPYSSKTVMYNNKKVPLWQLSKQGIKVPLPVHDVDIKDFKILSKKMRSFDEILSTVIKRINTLPNSTDFRQESIITTWKSHMNYSLFQVVNCEATVSTGTYIRSIGNKMLGCCYDINRITYSTMHSIGNKYSFFEYEKHIPE